MTDQMTHSTPAPTGAPPGPEGSAFYMEVQDVFRIAGGRTLFLGPVLSGGPRFITVETPRRCDVVLDGLVVQTVTLVGEFLTPVQERGVEPPRGVFTLDPVALDREAVRTYPCRLVETAV